ncbi:MULTISPECIES: NB-ARC domain-containing protein [unclassified Streptomyces]|uniref:NB-ARC domain-containing protein n=1 Tax=unclassified Streptomyces TaxID=2593676 RepID=UPI002E2CB7F5|nr:NB-ARC domain-containing protein [Streptomyces sp. NBC_00223]
MRFINRTYELIELDQLFGPADAAAETVRLGTLSGLPGVGKTAVVSRWAQTAKDRGFFPDGQLYVDYAALRHRAGSDVSEALGICLRELGVGESNLPASLEERTALYRRHTAGRRLLVVLDGVSKAVQVRPLLPKGCGSVVLATSHRRLGDLVAVDGARPVPVEPLDDDGALRLLADRCGAEVIDGDPASARRLVDLCGGLPVALHLVAARLQLRRRLTLSVLADELADESRRLAGMLEGEHSVSAVLSLVYGDMPTDEARFFRLLGWLPVRVFDAATAAVAGDLDLAAAERLLERLLDASVLEELPDGRFRMHDLVRLYARERAEAEEPPAEERALVERVIGRYLLLTALADRAVREDRLRVADLSALLSGARDPFRAVGGPRPLDWLEAERAGILAVLRAAARGGLHTPAWQLAEAFTVLFLHRRHLGDWMESLELGSRAAEHSSEPAAEARLRSLLSRPLMDLGEYERAREELDRALACAKAAGPEHTDVAASVQEFDGRYWDRFDPAKAVSAYERSLELNAVAELPRGEAIAAYFLGCAQDARGDHVSALVTLRDAHRRLLRLAKGPDWRMAARARAAMGAAYDHAGETSAAVRHLTLAAQALQKRDGSHYEAQTRVVLADLIERTGGSPEHVREHLARALAIYDSGGSPKADELRARLNRLRTTGED